MGVFSSICPPVLKPRHECFRSWENTEPVLIVIHLGENLLNEDRGPIELAEGPPSIIQGIAAVGVVRTPVPVDVPIRRPSGFARPSSITCQRRLEILPLYIRRRLPHGFVSSFGRDLATRSSSLAQRRPTAATWCFHRAVSTGHSPCCLPLLFRSARCGMRPFGAFLSVT